MFVSTVLNIQGLYLRHVYDDFPDLYSWGRREGSAEVFWRASADCPRRVGQTDTALPRPAARGPGQYSVLLCRHPICVSGLNGVRIPNSDPEPGRGCFDENSTAITVDKKQNKNQCCGSALFFYADPDPDPDRQALVGDSDADPLIHNTDFFQFFSIRELIFPHFGEHFGLLILLSRFRIHRIQFCQDMQRWLL